MTWTLDLRPLRERAKTTLDLGDAKQNEATLARDVLSLVAEVETMREINATQRDDRSNALGVIADSYPWEPYESDETIPGTSTPTNRRLAREALGV